MFWFAPDTETTRSDDYVLMRQVNASTPEVVVRNVLPDSVFPFFRYMYLKTDPVTSLQSIDTIPGATLPVTYASSLIVSEDKMRGVIISFTVTNGLADTAERTRPVSVIASLPNVGMRQLRTCGGPPLPTGAPTASWNSVTHSVDVTFTASPDETGGERDVMRYSVTRKSSIDPVWQNVGFIPAGGSSPYPWSDASVVQGGLITYWYAIAAQDCTPAFSSSLSSPGAVVP